MAEEPAATGHLEVDLVFEEHGRLAIELRDHSADRATRDRAPRVGHRRAVVLDAADHKRGRAGDALVVDESGRRQRLGRARHRVELRNERAIKRAAHDERAVLAELAELLVREHEALHGRRADEPLEHRRLLAQRRHARVDLLRRLVGPWCERGWTGATRRKP